MPTQSTSTGEDRFPPLSTAIVRRNARSIGLTTAGLLIAWITDTPAWGDGRITIRALSTYNLWGIVGEMPTHRAHFGLWYVPPELLGLSAGLALSLVAFAVTVYATARLANHLYGRNRGLLAGALVATSPFLVEQAGWLLPYSLLTGFASVTLWLTITDRVRVGALAAVGAAATHPWGWFVIAWYGFVTVRRHLRLAATTAVIGSIPMAYMVIARQLTSIAAFTGSSTNVTHARPMNLFDVLFAPIIPLVGTIHLLVLFPLVVLLTFAILSGGRWEVLSYVLLPIVGMFIASNLVHPVYIAKYLGFIGPGVAVLAVRPQHRRITAGIVIAIFLISALAWSGYPDVVCSVSIAVNRCEWVQTLVPSVIARRLVIF